MRNLGAGSAALTYLCLSWYAYLHMRTTLRIDDQLARQAKQRAASEGITLTALIEQSLRESLSRREQPRGRPELPTDSGDGPHPGADLADNRALRDRMDGLGR